VRHRVGNNLQVISSLLSLSGEFSFGEDEAEVLRSRIGIVLEVYRNAAYETGRTIVNVSDLVHSLIALSRASVGRPVDGAEVRWRGSPWVSTGP